MNYEDNLTIASFKLIRNKYGVHTKRLISFHVPNGGNRNAREGAKFKRMGVVPGIPDIYVDKSCGGLHGLRIELKSARLKDIVNGVPVWERLTYPRPEQRELLVDYHYDDYASDVAWTLNDVEEICARYFSGNWEPSEYMKSLIDKSKEEK